MSDAREQEGKREREREREKERKERRERERRRRQKDVPGDGIIFSRLATGPWNPLLPSSLPRSSSLFLCVSSISSERYLFGVLWRGSSCFRPSVISVKRREFDCGPVDWLDGPELGRVRVTLAKNIRESSSSLRSIRSGCCNDPLYHPLFLSFSFSFSLLITKKRQPFEFETKHDEPQGRRTTEQKGETTIKYIERERSQKARENPSITRGDAKTHTHSRDRMVRVGCSIWRGSLIRSRVSSQSSRPSRIPSCWCAAVSANKIICIRARNYLTNSSAYRAIKWPLSRVRLCPMPISSLHLLSWSIPHVSRRCLDTVVAPFQPNFSRTNTRICVHVLPSTFSLFFFYIWPVRHSGETPCAFTDSSIGGVQFNKYPFYIPLVIFTILQRKLFLQSYIEISGPSRVDWFF